MPGQDKEIVRLCFPGLLLSFKAYSSGPACSVNIVTQPYNHEEPDEFRIDPFDNDMPHNWALKQEQTWGYRLLSLRGLSPAGRGNSTKRSH